MGRGSDRGELGFIEIDRNVFEVRNLQSSRRSLTGCVRPVAAVSLMEAS